MNIVQMYLTINKFSRPGAKRAAVKRIVLHWVANPGSSDLGNRNYFENLKKQNPADNQKDIYASAHYIVDLDGSIVLCIPENEVAYHAGSGAWNQDSIGIEICHPDWTGKFNPATLNAVKELCVDICKRYGLKSSDIYRHYDVTKKPCPKWFVDYPADFNLFKASVEVMLVPKPVVNPYPAASNKWIQFQLNKAGYNLVVDGDLGVKSREAIRAFQKSRELVVDGIVGPRTIAALSRL
jgi:N-acetylmuramoyl-L-alanine amidase CwlA